MPWELQGEPTSGVVPALPPHTLSHGPSDTFSFTCGLAAAPSALQPARGTGAWGAAGRVGLPLLGGPGWAEAGLIPRLRYPAHPWGASPLGQALASGTGRLLWAVLVTDPGVFRGRGAGRALAAGLACSHSRSSLPLSRLPAQGPTLSLTRLPEGTAQQKEGGVPCEGSTSLPRT